MEREDWVPRVPGVPRVPRVPWVPRVPRVPWVPWVLGVHYSTRIVTSYSWEFSHGR